MLAMSHVAPGAPVGQASAALHTVLSQLSFTTDIVEEDQSRKPGSVWNGLFCFSFEDDDIDLFFDAHQSLRTYNESSDDCSSLVSVVEQIRGGGGRGEDGDGDNNDKKSQGKMIDSVDSNVTFRRALWRVAYTYSISTNTSYSACLVVLVRYCSSVDA